MSIVKGQSKWEDCDRIEASRILFILFKLVEVHGEAHFSIIKELAMVAILVLSPCLLRGKIERYRGLVTERENTSLGILLVW